MRHWMILTLLLSATASVAPAAQVTSGAEPPIYHSPRLNVACPVLFHADRNSHTVLRQADGTSTTQGEGLDLKFRSAPEHAILSADITVHGYAGGVIARPLTVTFGKEITEDFHLTGTAAMRLYAVSIWTKQMTAITWIELTRVGYADGTFWQRSAAAQCAIEPSLFVLV